MVCVGICALRHLKEDLAWAVDKRLQVISNKMLLKTVSYTTEKLKNKAILDLKQYCMHCYLALSYVF